MLAIILAIGVTLCVLIFSFKPVFGDRDNFFKCLRFYAIPDIMSLFRRELDKDWNAELKLGFWLSLAVLAGYLSWFALQYWLD